MGDDDATPMELYEPIVLQLVQDARHVQTTVVQFLGQSFHEDEEGLGTGRIAAVCYQETDHPFTQGLWRTAPQLLRQFLCLGGVVVDEIQAEHQEILQQTEHLLLIDGEQTDIRLGGHVSGVTLVIAKYRLLLDDVRGTHVFLYGESSVVSKMLHLHHTANHEIELVAGIPCHDDPLAGRDLHETEADMTRDDFQIIVAHSLEEGELQQLVVDLQYSHRRFFLFGDPFFQ